MAVWRLIGHHGDAEAQIQVFLDLGCVAIGWTEVGDLRSLNFTSATELTHLISASRANNENAHLGGPSLWRFYADVAIGDLVILNAGGHRRAVMRISGNYFFTSVGRSAELVGYGHRRAAQVVACGAEALWNGCGGDFAAGENGRWTFARCAGGGLPQAVGNCLV